MVLFLGRNIDALAANHDVIALDMPGHGETVRTAPGPARYDLAETTRFIEAALTGLGVERAVLVGDSWGGGWALAFAQAHPERVDRLVLIGSSGLPVQERPEWQSIEIPLVGELIMSLAGRRETETGLREAVRDPASVTPDDVEAVWWPMRRPQVRSAQVGFMRGLDWRTTQAAAAQTQTPTLILRGEADRYGLRRTSLALCRALPRARFVAVRNAGHVAHEDRPSEVDALILGFLAKPAPDGPDRCAWPPVAAGG